MEQKRTLSQAQIDANRRNAQRSTGPRTTLGKDASSRNAITHGLRADRHLILDEHPADFLVLLDICYRRYQPADESEIRMVERIAHLEWRISRSVTMEEGIFRQLLGTVTKVDFNRNIELKSQREKHQANPDVISPPPPPPHPADRLARAFHIDGGSAATIAQFQRYEGNLERSLNRTARLLANMQALRKQNTPQPDSEPEVIAPEVPPDEPAAPTTPSNSVSCQTKPKNEGIFPQAVASILLFLFVFLNSVEITAISASPTPRETASERSGSATVHYRGTHERRG